MSALLQIQSPPSAAWKAGFDNDVSSTTEETDNLSLALVSGKPTIRVSLSRNPMYLGGRNSNSTIASLQMNKLRFDDATMLYGRQHEIQQLSKAWQAAIQEGTKQMVLIRGASGCGKSKLALQSLELVRQAAGFYLQGKYEAASSNAKPFAAILDAFQGLSEELLLYRSMDGSNETNIYNWKFDVSKLALKLRETFSIHELAILQSTIFPRIYEVMGSSASSNTNDAQEDSNPMESKRAFHDVFRRLIRLLAFFGVVAIVVDDLQWADQQSIDLLFSLMGDPNTPSLLIIGTYRDNEVDQDHPISTAIQDFKAWKVPKAELVQIPIGNLSIPDISLLLQDLISLEEEQVLPLVQAVHRKTAGNVFYVKQFLLSLWQQELLQFNVGLMTWTFDMDKIQSKSMATENVVSLLTSKIKFLQETLQELLPRIACLGSKFKFTTVQLVVDHCCTPQQVAAALQDYNSKSGQEDRPIKDKDDTASIVLAIFENEGLVTKYNQGGTFYRWEHDQVRQSAIQLIDANDLPAIQYELGQLFLHKLKPNELTNELFVVTTLLNNGSIRANGELIDSLQPQHTLRIQLAQINLRAGKAALGLSAFGTAADFLDKGIALVPQELKWRKDLYNLSLDLYSTSTEANFGLGDHQKVKEHFEEVLKRLPNAPFLDKRRVYNMRIVSLQAQGLTREAKDIILEVLAKCGVRFPKGVLSAHVAAGVLRLVATIDKCTKKIGELKPMQKEEKKWAVFLLDRLGDSAYRLGDGDLWGLATLKGHRCTLNHGTADYTSLLLIQVAMILCNGVGDFASAKKYADLALQCTTRRSETRTKFIAYEFVQHHQLPFEKSMAGLLNAYRIGVRTGDLESAFWCLFSFMELSIMSSSNLPVLLKDCATYVREMQLYNFETAMWLSKLVWQVADNLVYPTSGRHLLQGNVIPNLAEFEATIAKDDEHVQRQLRRYKLFVAFWFNQHDSVVQMMEEYDYHNFAMEKENPCMPGVGFCCFYCALSCLSVARSNPSKEKKCVAIAKKFHSRLKAWVKKGDPNFQHCESLLEAELSTFGKYPLLAPKHYEVAILLAGRYGLMNDRALAHERYGDYATRKGDTNEASYQYNQAIEWYLEWGAEAKAEDLRRSVQDLLVPVSEVKTQLGEVDLSGLQLTCHTG